MHENDVARDIVNIAYKMHTQIGPGLVVNNKVVIEVKSIEALAPVHAKQLRTYLTAMDLRLGLLINFNVDLIKNGIRRVVNNLQE